MKISIVHSTIYRYDEFVNLEPHTFRLRPRTDCGQRPLTFEMHIAPEPAGTRECLDQDGNLAMHARFVTPTRELSVLTRFQVELLRPNPFDFVLAEWSLALPMVYLEPLGAALAPYRNRANVSEAVQGYARSLAADSEWRTLPFLSALNERLFQTVRQIVRPVGPPFSSAVTLHSLEGSCRDLAVLFCDACRAMGIAARFVSGYERAAAVEKDSYMHAWAEVYLPGAGWIGYDPARGVAVSESHVTIAAAFDHELASPVTGSYRGAAQSAMEACLSLQVGSLQVRSPQAGDAA